LKNTVFFATFGTTTKLRGYGMPKTRNEDRDISIVAMRETGATYAQIGARFGISLSRARDIVESRRIRREAKASLNSLTPADKITPQTKLTELPVEYSLPPGVVHALSRKGVETVGAFLNASPDVVIWTHVRETQSALRSVI
jgi:hypothetical protein